MDSRERQFLKPNEPMEVTVEGNLIFPIASEETHARLGEGVDFTNLFIVKKPSWMVVVVPAVSTSPFPSTRTYVSSVHGVGEAV